MGTTTTPPPRPVSAPRNPASKEPRAISPVNSRMFMPLHNPCSTSLGRPWKCKDCTFGAGVVGESLDFARETRYGRDNQARYPSGKGEVCKTFMRGFDSHPRLQPFKTKHILHHHPGRSASEPRRAAGG